MTHNGNDGDNGDEHSKWTQINWTQADTTRMVVDQFLRAWSVQDFEVAAEWFGIGATYVLHLSSDVVANAGDTRGSDAIRRAFLMQPETWSHVMLVPDVRAIVGETARIAVRFQALHRPSGELLASRMRLVARVTHRRIARLEEFHDAPLVEAFLRYAAWRTGQRIRRDKNVRPADGDWLTKPR